MENLSRHNVVNTTLGACSSAVWTFRKPYKHVSIYLYFKIQRVMNNDKNKSYNVRTIEANRPQSPYLVSPDISLHGYMCRTHYHTWLFPIKFVKHTLCDIKNISLL